MALFLLFVTSKSCSSSPDSCPKFTHGALLDPFFLGCGQVEEAFGKYDADGSGGIELGEFSVMWEQMQLADYLGKVPQAPAQSAAAGSAVGGAEAVTAPREEAQYATCTLFKASAAASCAPRSHALAA